MLDDRARSAEPSLLPPEAIRRDASSYVDPQGFVFHHQGEVYRFIRPDAAGLYGELLDEGVLERLEGRGLVPTRRAGLRLAEAPEGLVLHHQRVEPLSYCVEWCPSMLRDAALTTLDLALAAAEHGLMLQDAYPWNVLFDGPRCVFVDLTSIVRADRRLIWPAHEQFEAFFYRPLVLAGRGHGDVARALLYNNIGGIDLATVYRLTSAGHHLRHPGLWLAHWLDRRLQRSARWKSRVRRMAERLTRDVTPELRGRFLRRLIRRTRALRFRSRGDPWTNYYAEIGEAFDKQAKLRAVRAFLERIRPVSVLDLGCNTGVFSIEAARCGARVVSVDSSEPCIELLYAFARKEGLKITPLVADVLCPTPAFGFMGRQYPALWERVRSDTVLCLGLMHHLHLTGRQSWERIVELVAGLTGRHLVFEFVAMDDANIERLPQRRRIDYCLDSVAAALRTRFADVEVHPSDRETRRLLLCTK